jgi:hypothetical protein
VSFVCFFSGLNVVGFGFGVCECVSVGVWE